MGKVYGYIPGKEAAQAAPAAQEPDKKHTPKQEAIAEAELLGINLPEDVSKITEAQIRKLIEEQKDADVDPDDEEDADVDPDDEEDEEDNQ